MLCRPSSHQSSWSCQQVVRLAIVPTRRLAGRPGPPFVLPRFSLVPPLHPLLIFPPREACLPYCQSFCPFDRPVHLAAGPPIRPAVTPTGPTIPPAILPRPSAVPSHLARRPFGPGPLGGTTRGSDGKSSGRYGTRGGCEEARGKLGGTGGGRGGMVCECAYPDRHPSRPLALPVRRSSCPPFVLPWLPATTRLPCVAPIPSARQPSHPSPARGLLLPALHPVARLSAMTPGATTGWTAVCRQ